MFALYPTVHVHCDHWSILLQQVAMHCQQLQPANNGTRPLLS